MSTDTIIDLSWVTFTADEKERPCDWKNCDRATLWRMIMDSGCQCAGYCEEHMSITRHRMIKENNEFFDNGYCGRRSYHLLDVVPWNS